MDFLLFLFALALGIVATIPIGPCQIETIKRAIGGHLVASEMVVVGSASADVVYGVIALYGIAPVLDFPSVRLVFEAAVVIILLMLAGVTWRHANEPEKLYHEPKFLRSRRWAYLTGFVLGMSNPPIIASWLFGVALARRLGVAPTPFTTGAKASFIVGAVLGAGGYLTALALITHRMRHSFSVHTIATIYRCLAVALLILSFYFAGSLIVHFLRHGAFGLM